MIIPKAEPFFYPGNRVGCLLVHGFTGTPDEMHLLGKHLAGEGFSVLGIRLFAHATSPQDMLRAQWHDWYASVEDGWYLLSNITDRIILIGLSLGGILSLYFASQFPATGVIAMATPHHLPNDPRKPFIRIISWFLPYIQKGNPKWFEEKAYNERICYPVDPTRAYLEVDKILREMRSNLAKVTCPVLLMYSIDDPTIKIEDQHMQNIYDNLGSTNKKYCWIENSGHVLTRDLMREKVFNECSKFASGFLNY